MSALETYIKAKKAGMREVQRDISSGRYPYVPSLEEFVTNADIAGEYPVGLAEIPVDMIAGTRTKGRQNAFSRSFMPVLSENSEFAAKWQYLYESQLEEGIRDPIKVYEYMQKFYVEEGNKRVSVTRFVDMPLIMADVTRLLPVRTDDRYNRIYYEFLRFYEAAPIYEISFSEEGCFGRLAEAAGESLDTRWPDEKVDALRSAYHTFTDIFEAKGGEQLSLTEGDAFLIYLTIYSLESLLADSRPTLEKRISSIWNEILTKTRDDNIEVVDNPDTIEWAGTRKGAGAVLDILLKPRLYTQKDPLRIGFIHDGNPEDSGWIYGHELGRNALEQRFDGIVATERYDQCRTDEEIAAAVESAADNGCELIVTTSPAQMPETLRQAIAFPKIKFMNCSVNLSHNAVRCYYGRMYEAKFLMGALAASAAENHRIGYRADYPIYGTVANINAFAIGAGMIDPEARLFLTWSTKKDANWREEMYSQGVSVYSGPDLIRPRAASREYGIYQMDGNGGVFNLAAPVWDWGKYYELIVRTILDGTWNAREIARPDQALNYWWGMQSGVIDVIMSERISYYSRKLVAALRNSLVAGTLNPFDGELRSQEGLIKGADSPRLNNLEIIKMDWLNDNVEGSLPAIEELREKAQETARVSGVVKGT